MRLMSADSVREDLIGIFGNYDKYCRRVYAFYLFTKRRKNGIIIV